jgi:LPS sulfotransferase NodH
MHLTIDELLDYTDEERAKWEDWFAAHGNDPLNFTLPSRVLVDSGHWLLRSA